MRSHPAPRPRAEHPYQAFWEPLEGDSGFELKPMFGGKAAYLDGRLALYFSAKEEPWRGILVCTDRERQAALVAEFPELAPHPVLPKWLYLPEDCERFERIAARLVTLARIRDPRLGVEPSRRRKAGRSARERFRPDTIGVRSAESPGRERSVNAADYAAVRSALERLVPAKGEGLSAGEMLAAALASGALRTRFASRGVLARWLTTVRLDLEVRGVLRRRKGGRPARWLRATGRIPNIAPPC